MIGSKFIHLIRTDSNAFVFMAELYSIKFMYHSFFIHSFVDGHLGCFHVLAIVKWSEEVKVAQLCPTLCNPMDYTVHVILQARILEWVAVPFSRGSSQPRDRTQVSCIAGRFFTRWDMREAQEYWSG